MANELDLKQFKFLLHNIFEKFFSRELSLEQYLDGIEKGVKGFKKGPSKFFGSQANDPFQHGGSNYKEKSLKSEILKNDLLLKHFDNYYRKISVEKYLDCFESKNVKNINIGTKYHLNDNDLDDYRKAIKKSSLNEEAFEYIANNFNIKRLDDLRGELNNGKIKFPFAKWLDIYCLYAGFKDVTDFLIKSNEYEKSLAEKKALSTLDYVGLYYSFTEHEVVKDVVLSIDTSNNTYNIYAHGFYHNPTHNYHSVGVKIGDKLHITLNEVLLKENNNLVAPVHPIHIILNLTIGFEKQECIRGTFMYVSLDGGHIYCKELLLIKKGVETQDYIRYVFMQRRNFRVKNKPLIENNILVNKQDVKNYTNIIGYWKVWRFDNNFNITESILHIKDDYKAVFYSKNLNQQITKKYCDFEVSKVKNDDILCSTWYNNYKIQDFFMIPIPNRNNLNSIQGVILSNDNDVVTPIKRGIVLQRIANWKDADLDKIIENELKFYSTSQIIDKLTKEKRSDFSKLFNTLCKVELSSSLPHWALSFLNYYDYYSHAND